MPELIRTLILDGVQADAEFEVRELRRAGIGLDWRAVEAPENLAVEIESFHPQLILGHDSPASGRAREALRSLAARDPELPVLVVTGSTDEANVSSWMADGAWECVFTDRLVALAPAVRRALERARLLTERQFTDDRLRMLEQAIEHSPAVILITDPNERIEYVNPAFTRVSGYQPAEALGRTPALLESGEVDSVRLLEIADAMSAGRTWRGELVNRRKNGSLYTEELVIFPVLDDAGNVRHFVSIALDVPARRRAEQALRASEERLRKITATEPECIKIVDRTGAIVEMNPAGLRMLQASSLEQVQGHAASELVVPEDRGRFDAALQAALRGEEVALEFEVVGLEGERRCLSMRAVPLSDESGRIDQLLGLTRDVTESRRAAEELQRTNEELTRFNRLSVGRELRMIELKREVNELSLELAREPPYSLDFVDSNAATAGESEIPTNLTRGPARAVDPGSGTREP